ncbi:LysR family transcriptional regulator [Photobacterium minamisatsumaniensis]|uniref:LysR family transcriptional regulator n=1 Tax=Photobacterium minamisatsumaniensis TaxID=2910233 RepID=UPI003D0D4EF5
MDRLTAMQVFAVVVDRGSFTAAAKHLDLSRVKVTRYVAELESWLGARLLQRTTRSLALTPAGKQFHSQCLDVLDLTKTIEHTLSDASVVPSGKLRITSTSAFAISHLTEAIVDFQQQYPDVSIDMNIQDYKVNLVDEQVDLAIRIADELDPGLIARKLAPCNSVLCASPHYLEKAGMPSDIYHLSQHQCLLFSHFDTHQWQLRQGAILERIAVNGDLRSNDVMVLYQAAKKGAGIARLPRYLVDHDLASGELIEVLPQWQVNSMAVWGIYLSRKHMPASLRVLLDFMVERFKDNVNW